MTNAERNLAIAKLVYPDEEIKKLPFGDSLEVWLNDVDILDVDYCNKWNDLMPLVVEHFDRIDATPDRGIIAVRCKTSGYWHSSKNNSLQITLAECLLKVLEAKQ